MAASASAVRVMELYCGIGGMHYALQDAGLLYEVVAAVDINTVTNNIYRHNFPEVNLMQRSIESLTADEIANLSVDMVLMSPPCQPFTRVGLKKDEADTRTKSFFHLMQVFKSLERLPNFVLVENVKGFDNSLTRQKLLETLHHCQYNIQEFLLSPVQFNIPNSRLRYFLIGRLKPFSLNVKQMKTALPETDVAQIKPDEPYQGSFEDNGSQSYQYPTTQSNSIGRFNEHTCRETESTSATCITLREYLEVKSPDYFEPYLVKDKELKRYFVMDIVASESTSSCCFTKRYGRHIEGAGSQIQMVSSVDSLKDHEQIKADLRSTDPVVVQKAVDRIRPLKLRYFTPKEISLIMGFPESFSFPPQTSTMQKYRALGNSLNVHVVSCLVKVLLHGTPHI